MTNLKHLFATAITYAENGNDVTEFDYNEKHDELLAIYDLVSAFDNLCDLYEAYPSILRTDLEKYFTAYKVSRYVFSVMC